MLRLIILLYVLMLIFRFLNKSESGGVPFNYRYILSLNFIDFIISCVIHRHLLCLCLFYFTLRMGKLVFITLVI